MRKRRDERIYKNRKKNAHRKNKKVEIKTTEVNTITVSPLQNRNTVTGPSPVSCHEIIHG